MNDTLIETLQTAVKIAALAALLSAATAGAADLTISVNEIRKDEGRVMLNLLNSEAQMSGTGGTPPVSITLAPTLTPNTNGLSFTLHNVPSGTYGVQVMHDVNNNGELDANMIGIPKEPWAFSNNAAGRFGPPKWADVQFTISDDDTRVEQSIDLRH